GGGEIEQVIETDEKNDPDPEEAPKDTQADQKRKVDISEKLPIEEPSKKIDKTDDNLESSEQKPPTMQGVLDVTLFKTPNLTATKSTVGDKERITLTFTSSGTLDLGLLKSAYIIFHVP